MYVHLAQLLPHSNMATAETPTRHPLTGLLSTIGRDVIGGDTKLPQLSRQSIPGSVARLSDETKKKLPHRTAHLSSVKATTPQLTIFFFLASWTALCGKKHCSVATKSSDRQQWDNNGEREYFDGWLWMLLVAG